MPWFTVRVPASSANLGPGFDALGLALGVYLTCRFRAGEKLSISVSGRDAGCISKGPDNLIWQTSLAVAGSHRMRMPALELEIANDIPVGKGMGSSAAALTAGVVIADRLLGLNWKPLRILDEAARLEGHPDNVAACTLGSIVASAIDSGGVARAVRLDLPQRFGVAVVVPDFDLPTAKARAVLHGRYYVSCEDIRAVAAPVLRHRIITNFNAEAEGIKPDDIVRRLADMIPRDPNEEKVTA